MRKNEESRKLCYDRKCEKFSSKNLQSQVCKLENALQVIITFFKALHLHYMPAFCKTYIVDLT